VLSVEDWAEIRRLRRAEGMSVSAIARLLGVSRNTVSSALACWIFRLVGSSFRTELSASTRCG
jgi:DNA-binding CsgD family transcriptional regulator